MLRRNILSDLLKWATSSDRKPLIVRGARQVGKSTLVQLLADALGYPCVTVDLERRPELADLFSSNEPLSIIQWLRIFAGDR